MSLTVEEQINQNKILQMILIVILLDQRTNFKLKCIKIKYLKANEYLNTEGMNSKERTAR